MSGRISTDELHILVKKRSFRIISYLRSNLGINLHDWFIIVDVLTNVNEKDKRNHAFPTFISVQFRPQVDNGITFTKLTPWEISAP